MSTKVDLPFPSNTSGSSKQVFAHYVTPFPVSFDNKATSEDYYSKNYLQPSGENSKFAASGGFIRDRPLGRSALSGDYASADLANEIRVAKAAGIDGFSLDLMATSGDNWTRTLKMLDAAHATDPSFKIMLMPDSTCLTSLSTTQMSDLLAKLADKPSAYRLSDGRLVVAPFAPEKHPYTWWAEVGSKLKADHGITMAFVPTFVATPSNLDQWATISYGMSNWGGRSAGNIGSQPGQEAKKYTKMWMQAVAVQDSRPASGVYDEAGALNTLRASWEAAFATGAQWVQLTTWNDYAETTAIAPSVHHGASFLNINAYYIAKFKTGSYPNVTRNAIYVTHRQQMHETKPTYPQTVLQKLRWNSSSAVNVVEVTTFLTKAATVTATVGGVTTKWTAPAGYSHRQVDLRTGSVSATAQLADGLLTVTSPFGVSSSPYVQDMQYVCAGSTR